MAIYHDQIDGRSSHKLDMPAMAPRFNWGLVLGLSANLAVWCAAGFLIANLL